MGTPVRGPRFAIEPLLEIAGTSIIAVERRLGFNLHRARREGGLSWISADRCAIRLGLHPCFVWPEWFDDELGRDLSVCPVPGRSAG